MLVPTITIRGAWAEIAHLEGWDRLFHAYLAPLDPNRQRMLAFREQRWDGKQPLYDGKRFPAGLVKHFVAALHAEGYPDVKIVQQLEKKALDVTRFNPEYVNGFTLRQYQMAAVLSALKPEEDNYSNSGFIKSPTGSGKTLIAFCIARYYLEECGWTSLILVPKKGLCTQTVKNFRKWAKGDFKIGQCGDGKKTIGDITISTGSTMLGYKPRIHKSGKGRKFIPANPLLQELMAQHRVLILDEAHHGSSTSWYDISLRSKAHRRIGLSGTPLSYEELADARLIAATGPMLYEVAATELIEAGDVAEPKIVMVMSENASGPPLGTTIKTRLDESTFEAQMGFKDAYVAGIVKNPYHNAAVVRAVKWFVDRNFRTLIICRRKEHFRALDKLLQKTGIDYSKAWGATDTTERELLKSALSEGRIRAALCSTIMDEGEDIPGVDAIVLAEGLEGFKNAIQRVGRGMRKKKGFNHVYIVDFVPTCHPTLMKHALARCVAYETEGYEVELLEKWPMDAEFDEDLLLPFELKTKGAGESILEQRAKRRKVTA